MDVIEISKKELDLAAIVNNVKDPSCGAISVFMGTTRDNFNDKKVIKLEYEAHDTMAVKEIKKICEDIRRKWEVQNIAIAHRVGIVPVMESSVIIVVTSKHRKEAIEAVNYAINTLKEMVPIWKKEIYEDGSSNWKDNSNPNV